MILFPYINIYIVFIKEYNTNNIISNMLNIQEKCYCLYGHVESHKFLFYIMLLIQFIYFSFYFYVIYLFNFLMILCLLSQNPNKYLFINMYIFNFSPLDYYFDFKIISILLRVYISFISCNNIFFIDYIIYFQISFLNIHLKNIITSNNIFMK